ncbi:MAG: translin family protein [Nanobdellota archaeon]
MPKDELFSRLREQYDKDEEDREYLIRKSREIVRLSKTIISSLHSGELPHEKIENIRSLIGEITNKYDGTKHYYSGSFKVAVQEYYEALIYYYFEKDNGLLGPDDNLDYEFYLLGLCDVSGELVRRALKEGIDGNFDRIKSIYDFVSSIYEELSKFGFRSNELRKGTDRIRWDLKKLEEMMFQVRMNR